MRLAIYTHKFVKSFPEKLENGILYVSVEFGSAAHVCFCGCGSEVYTRFSPRDWSMQFNGETVSINPSIGNWSFPCQSHYILAKGAVHWADRWSRERIDVGRTYDRGIKDRHYRTAPTAARKADRKVDPSPDALTRFWRWFSGK